MLCGCDETKVVDSRPTEEGAVIRRRRQCLECNRRFTTYEKVERLPLMVIKKDKRRQPFDIDKIIAGLVKACEKRPVPTPKIQDVVAEIDVRIRLQYEYEVPSEVIGELVMEKLRDIDEVAYVRFASVYRQFADIEGFREELEQLRGRKGMDDQGEDGVRRGAVD